MPGRRRKQNAAIAAGLLLLLGLTAACEIGDPSPGAAAATATPAVVLVESQDTAVPPRIAATPIIATRIAPAATRVAVNPTPIPVPSPTALPEPTQAPATLEPTPELNATATAIPTATPAPTATPRPPGPTAADSFDPAGLAVGPGSGFISLDEPVMIPAGDAIWLDDEEIVMGLVAHNGETRAFPVRQMAYHHIANLSVAGVPYLVTY